MPQLNMKGPESKGSKSGRGLGLCKKILQEENLKTLGIGMGKRRKSGGGSGKGKRLQSGLIK